MNCPKCGAKLEEGTRTCPECGTSLEVSARTRRPSALAIVIGVALTVVALLFLGAIPAIGVAALSLLWIAPTEMSLPLKLIITVVLAALIVALPIVLVLSGSATFTF